MMIVSIRHRGLKRLWTKDDGRGLPSDHLSKIKLILTLLDAAEKISDMNFPGSSLHPLKGSMVNTGP
jgi:proteic killer suppression protein